MGAALMPAPGDKTEDAQNPAQTESPAEETMTQPSPIDSSEDMDSAALQEAYNHSFKNISEGSVMQGTVLKVSGSSVVVDVGFKSEGFISLEEFRDEEGKLTVEVGDQVEVLLERTEDRNGNASHEELWPQVAQRDQGNTRWARPTVRYAL